MSQHQRVIATLCLIFLGLVADDGHAQTWYKNNGIMALEFNGPWPICDWYYCDYWTGPFPMITSMWVTGLQVMPHQHAGADFQMTTRSVAGDAWNPTLAGDCAETPSLMTSFAENHSHSGSFGNRWNHH